MKAAVTYQASMLPKALAHIPIIRKTGGGDYANKKEFTDFVDSKGTLPDADRYVIVICQCKKTYDYVAKEDFPSSSFSCDCGRKVIQFGS